MSTLSVLIPIYYKERASTIQKCLDSMTKQTVLPDEIVCALDYPSSQEIDDTIDEFKKRTALKMKKCYCERGKGLGAVLRTGVENCSCDYIARMDADDIAVAERLEKERDYLDEHPNVDVVGSNIAEFSDNIDNIIAYRNVPSQDKECKQMLKRRDPINHMTAMYRKESVLKAGNYSAEMKSCEDTFLWTSFFANNLTFANIQENLVLAHAGKEMYERRGGKKAYYYVKKAIEYKKTVGLINDGEALFQKTANYIILVLISNRARSFIYEKLLRTHR